MGDGHGDGVGVDFFVSYAGPDRPWVEWVATELVAAGFGVELDVWDWVVGDSFVSRMSQAVDRTARVVSLWSPAHFEQVSWRSRWLRDCQLFGSGAETVVRGVSARGDVSWSVTVMSVSW